VGATYALRKQTVEPVFGIIKSVLGFGQFSLRGSGQGNGGMELGLLGVEYQAHGRTPSKIWITKGNALKNRQNGQNLDELAYFLSKSKMDVTFGHSAKVPQLCAWCKPRLRKSQA
jgi:hypothetical protein